MSLEEELAHLRADLQRLQAENAELRAALAAAQQLIAELEHQKTPPPFVKANVPARPKQARKKRAPPFNRARQRDLPTQVMAHLITCCPTCQGRLSSIRLARRRQVIEVPLPPPVQVSEHQVFKGWCSYCRHWQEARLDLSGQVLGQGRLGVGVASLVAHLRSVGRLPLRAIQALHLRLYGLHVSVGELVDLLRRVSQVGAAAVEHLHAEARASQAVHADETGWRENGRNGYIWSLSTSSGVRYFEYHHSRAGQVAQDLLGEDFRGVLISDFYGGYNDTPGRHQRCWVHLLRDLHTLKTEHADTLEVRLWAEAVKDLYQRAWTVRGLEPERGRAYRELVLCTRALGEQFAQAKGHPCQALARRLLRHQDELFVFVVVEGVAAENNQAERALQPLVVARKISGGSRSPAGSATRMRLASLFGTWQARGLNPLHECLRLLQSPYPNSEQLPLLGLYP